jgi:hypothetical protein
MQVLQVHEQDIDSPPPVKSLTSLVHDPPIRESLIARLPQSLLFGRQGDVGAELEATAPSLTTNTATHHHRQQQQQQHQHYFHQPSVLGSFGAAASENPTATKGASFFTDGDVDDYQPTQWDMDALMQSMTTSLPSPLVDQYQQQMMFHHLASPAHPHLHPLNHSPAAPSAAPPAASLAERWLSM